MNDINAILPHVKLKFNIEHPSYEDCYNFGYECAQGNLDIDDNPFQEQTLEAEHWREGWWAGFYGEEPLFGIEESVEKTLVEDAANDTLYHKDSKAFFSKVLKITGALAASAVVGYQVIDLVA